VTRALCTLWAPIFYSAIINIKIVPVRSFTAILGLLVSCLLSIPARAQPERLTIAYPQWPPYKIVQNGSIGGIDALVLDEIARRTGLEFEYVECPWARCLIMLQNGSVDMITSIARTAERTAVMDFLEPPTRDNYAISFYTSVAAPHALHRYEDLAGLDIGIIRGSAYFERFDRDRTLLKTLVTRETQLIDMLAGGRLDVILGIGANLDYLLQESGRSRLVKKWSLRIGTEDPAYIAVSKKSRHKAVIPRLEKALREMRRANEIERIEQGFFKALARDQR
jgi:polar amino acid transport system substrate-binding protein